MLRHWTPVKPSSPEVTQAAVTSDFLADLHSNASRVQTLSQTESPQSIEVRNPGKYTGEAACVSLHEPPKRFHFIGNVGTEEVWRGLNEIGCVKRPSLVTAGEFAQSQELRWGGADKIQRRGGGLCVDRIVTVCRGMRHPCFPTRERFHSFRGCSSLLDLRPEAAAANASAALHHCGSVRLSVRLSLEPVAYKPVEV